MIYEMPAELNGMVHVEQETSVDPEERDYLSQRVRAEQKAANTANDPHAALAHKSLANLYLARLRRIEIVPDAPRISRGH